MKNPKPETEVWYTMSHKHTHACTQTSMCRTDSWRDLSYKTRISETIRLIKMPTTVSEHSTTSRLMFPSWRSATAYGGPHIPSYLALNYILAQVQKKLSLLYSSYFIRLLLHSKYVMNLTAILFPYVRCNFDAWHTVVSSIIMRKST
jgi:hypothetical protein